MLNIIVLKFCTELVTAKYYKMLHGLSPKISVVSGVAKGVPCRSWKFFKSILLLLC